MRGLLLRWLTSFITTRVPDESAKRLRVTAVTEHALSSHRR